MKICSSNYYAKSVSSELWLTPRKPQSTYDQFVKRIQIDTEID